MEYENTLLERFPPFCGVESVLANDIPILLRPGIIVDNSGNVLAWALPGILSMERQVRTRASLCVGTGLNVTCSAIH